MSKLYCWDNDLEEVVAFEEALSREPDAAYFKYAVDDAIGRDSEKHRYGMYTRGDSGDDNWEWVSIPKELFPKKFLTHLLLLGVS